MTPHDCKTGIRDIKYYAAHTDCLLEYLLATSRVVAGSGLWFISVQKATGIRVRLVLYLMFSDGCEGVNDSLAPKEILDHDPRYGVRPWLHTIPQL